MLASAVFAGFAAGLIAALLQFAFVQPVLLQAELYESGELNHFNGVSEIGASDDGHSHAEPEGDGSAFMRNALSVVFSGLIYVAYALILVAGFALAATRGLAVTARSGVIWGSAGFVAVHLAPGFGLAPELPGSSAAEVGPRQVWWFFCVAATTLGLALIGLGQSTLLWGLGIIAIALPHIIGAPQPTAFNGVAPPELASLFAARAFGVGLAAWACLGLFAGYLWQRDAA